MTIRGGLRNYPEVSFLRGFSITTVILMHLLQVYTAGGDLPGWLRMAAAFGGTGGHMFFFCSGFGLYLSQMRKELSFPEFIRRRFLKIYLPYILVIVITWAYTYIGFGRAMNRELLSHVFLYKMFIEKYEISFGLQFWFLSTIIQLYLLFLPLCRLRKAVGTRKLVILSLCVSMAWWVFTWATGLAAKRIWGSFCLQYLWEFVLGMAAAEYLAGKDQVNLSIGKLAALAAGGIVLEAVMAVTGGLAAAFNDLPAFFGYGAFALLLYACCRRVIRPVFLRVDTISYEWFLVHVLSFSVCYEIFRAIGRRFQESSLGVLAGAGRMPLPAGAEFLLAVLAVVVSLVFAWLYSRLLLSLRLREAGKGKSG